jgi:anti-anti-sigma regulatory factor
MEPNALGVLESGLMAAVTFPIAVALARLGPSGIDGELLRLISYSEADDFMFALLQNFESGWCIGKSSPMWNNTENVLNLIKGYEFGDVESSSAYPWINDTYIAIDKTSDPHYITIENVPADTASGIDDSGDETQAQEVGFDLSKLSFIDEEGLQHLLSLVQRTDGGWSVRFSICGVNPRIEGMFTLDCLIQAFENADIEVRETAA